MVKIRKQSYHKHYYPEEMSGICVVKRKGESGDDLIKRFRKKWSRSGLAKELRERMYHEKPSDKKRRKKMQCIRAIEREKEKRAKLEIKIQKMRAKKAKLRRKGAKKNDSSNK